jgi:hypothetical protein
MNYRTMTLPKGEVRVWDPDAVEAGVCDPRHGHVVWDCWSSGHSIAKQARGASMDAKALSKAAKDAVATWEADTVEGRVRRLLAEAHEYREWAQRRYEGAVCAWAKAMADEAESGREDADVSGWASHRDTADKCWGQAVNVAELLLTRRGLNALLEKLLGRG